jgi:hypothetical protein
MCRCWGKANAYVPVFGVMGDQAAAEPMIREAMVNFMVAILL